MGNKQVNTAAAVARLGLLQVCVFMAMSCAAVEPLDHRLSHSLDFHHRWDRFRPQPVPSCGSAACASKQLAVQCTRGQTCRPSHGRYIDRRSTPTSAVSRQQHPGGSFESSSSSSSSSLARTSSSSSSALRLFVGVLSASKNRDRRDAIRQTWGSDPRLARVVFVLGRPQSYSLLAAVQAEAAVHHDIILVGHTQEHYLNITHQTLEIFRAAYAHQQLMHLQQGGLLTHVVKTDDDSYMHVTRLLQALADRPMQRMLTGGFFPEYVPETNPTSKFYSPPGVWPDDHPKFPYAVGAGYVLTMDLVEPIALGAAVGVGCEPGAMFHFEDVAVGLWLYCLQQQQRDIRIRYSHVRLHVNGCVSKWPDALFSHKLSAAEIRCMHARGGMCCNPEGKRR